MGLFLTEGGVAGHMNHLYDNPDLTFKKMKDIFAQASNGELEGTEKTDGQNLFVSYSVQTGQARGVRNKGENGANNMNSARNRNRRELSLVVFINLTIHIKIITNKFYYSIFIFII